MNKWIIAIHFYASLLDGNVEGDEDGLYQRIRIFFGSGSGSAQEWKAGSGSALEAKFRSFKAQNRAVKGRGSSKWRRGGSQWKPGGWVGQWSQIRITLMRSRIRINIEGKSLFRIPINLKAWSGSAFNWCGSEILVYITPGFVKLEQNEPKLANNGRMLSRNIAA